MVERAELNTQIIPCFAHLENHLGVLDGVVQSVGHVGRIVERHREVRVANGYKCDGFDGIPW